MALGRVLIVDDQAYARQAVGLLLSKAGYEVIEAEDGQKAIQIMNEEGNAYKVDTILCDLKMPNLDGPQAITYFQTHCPSIPIVIMTGEPDFVLTEGAGSDGLSGQTGFRKAAAGSGPGDRSPARASEEAALG